MGSDKIHVLLVTLLVILRERAAHQQREIKCTQQCNQLL